MDGVNDFLKQGKLYANYIIFIENFSRWLGRYMEDLKTFFNEIENLKKVLSLNNMQFLHEMIEALELIIAVIGKDNDLGQLKNMSVEKFVGNLKLLKEIINYKEENVKKEFNIKEY